MTVYYATESNAMRVRSGQWPLVLRLAVYSGFGLGKDEMVGAEEELPSETV